VPNFGHSAKTCFVECRTRQNLALGKEVFWHSAKVGKARHTTKIEEGRRHPAISSLPSVCRSALGKVITLPSAKPRHSAIFFVFWHQIFLKLYYTITNNMLKFGTFSLLFGLFLYFILFC
jgi:hypothetical protein